MKEARRGACSVLLPDGRVLIAGGQNEQGPLVSAELFDGSGSFTETAPMHAARAGQMCAALPGGRVLVAGGRSFGGGIIESSETYDPASDTWSLAGSMMEPRSGATASRLPDGKILVAGGDTGTAASATLEVFDPALGTFSAIPGALSSPRRTHSAASLKDGRVLIAGGTDGKVALDSVDFFDPAAGRIAQTLKMSSPRDGLSATRLLDGRVLLAGGNNGSADLETAELFDPKSSAFSAAPPMLTARRDHLAFLLPDNNTVLIVGGTAAGAPLATSEQFVPWQKTFKSTDSLSKPRTGVIGTPLKTPGVMMVAGGATPQTTADATAASMGFTTVTTDKPDYQPGDFVTITGAGFGANEVVAITIVEDPDLDGDSPIQFNVTADVNGGFTDSHFAIDTADLNVSFTLTATGQTSRFTAQTTFTDAKPNTVTLNTQTPNPAPVGGNATYTVTVGFNGTPNQSCTATLSGTPSTSGGAPAWPSPPPGGFFSFSPTSVTSTGADATTTLTVNTTGLTANTTYRFTVTANGNSCTQMGSATTTLPIDLVTSSSIGTTTSVASSANPSLVGQSVSFKATISPSSATGAVQFKIDGAPFGSTVPVSGGTATSGVTSSLTLGNHTVTADYAHTGSFNDSSGTLNGGQAVNKANTSTTVSSSQNPSVFAQSVTFTANISVAVPGSGAIPNGETVTFKDGLTTLGTGTTSGGSATFSTSSLSVTSHSITAVYAGDTNFNGGTSSTLSQVVNKADTTTTVTSSPTGTYGQTAMAALSATVTADSPSTATVNEGTVTFTIKQGATTIATVTSGTVAAGAGGASLSFSGINAGVYSIAAMYNPATTTPSFNTSSAATTGTLTVGKASTTPAIAASNKMYDGTGSASVTCSVSPTIGTDDVACSAGSATFSDKNVAMGKTVTATGITLTGAAAGNYQLSTATATATANITARALTVTAATNSKTYDATTSAAAPPTVTSGVIQTGDTANFSEAYDIKNAGTGKVLTPSGTVTDGNSGNNYTYSFVANTTGVINKAPLSITSATNTKSYDGTTSAAATPVASGLQTGDTVTGLSETYDNKNFGTGKTLTVAGYTINDGNTGGNYTVTLGTNTTGVISRATLTITAVSNTKPYDATSTAAAIPTTSGLQSGDTVTGLVESYDTPAAGSGKTLTVSGYAVNDTNGGNNYTVVPVPNNSGVILQATPGITESGPGASTYGVPVTVSVAVTPPSGGAPMGTVTFTFVQNTITKYLCSDGHVDTNPCNVNVTLNGGVYGASVTTNQLPPGMDGITATYSGDTNFTGGAASNVSVTVSQADTATTVAKSMVTSIYGDSVTLTVKVKDNTSNSTGVPTGTAALSFKLDGSDPNTYYLCSDGSIPLAPCTPAQGLILSPDPSDPTGALATVNTSKLPAGLLANGFSYTINGSYSGDTNFKSSGPVGLSQTVNQRPITVTAASDSKPYDGNATSAGMPAITSGTLANGDTGQFIQAFDNRNAGTAKTLTPSGSVHDGFSGNNYAVTFTSVNTGIITARAITVTAATDTKTYDGTTSSSVTPNIAPALISPDAPGFAQAFANKNVGTGKTLIPSGSVNDNNGGNNYVVTFVNNATGVINAAQLTITAKPNTKTYDSTKSAAALPTYSGLKTDDTVAGLVETYDNPNAGSGKTLSVMAYTVNDNNSGNNYTVTTVADHTGVINAATLTITAVTNTKTYDSNTSAAAMPTVSGLQGGTDSVSNRTETYDTKHVGNTKVLSVATYTVNDGNSGNNYTVTKVDDHTGVINPASLTITAATNTKVYDATTSASAIPTVSGLQGMDTVTGQAEVYDNKNAGTGKTLSVSAYTVNDGNSGNDYAVSKVDDHSGVINKAPLTITAISNTKTYDGNTSAAATPTFSGLQTGDTATATETYTNKNAGSGKALTVTSYTVTDGYSGNNYLVTKIADSTGVINQAPLTVTATGANKVYDSSATATVTLLDNRIAGDVFTDSYASAVFTDKYVANGKTINVSGISIAGTDAGNYTFNPAAVATADITAKTITGSITASNKVYDRTTAAMIANRSLSGVIGTDMVTYVGGTATFGDKNVGTGKAVTATGLSLSGADAGNYSVNSTAATTADITPLAIVGSITASGKVYDGTAVATILAKTLAGVISGDSASYTGGAAAFADKNVGTGKTVTATGLSLSGGDAGNYTVNSTATTTADISRHSLTVIAAGVSRMYNGTTTATVTLSDDKIGGDAVTDAYMSASFSDKNVGAGKTVSVAGISISGTDAGNYSANTTAATTANITALSITGSITAANKVYDQTATATILTRPLSGVITPDSVTYTGGIANFADKNVGNGKNVTATGLSLTGMDAGNYTVNSTATTTANITALAVVGSITAWNKIYDGTTAAVISGRTVTGVISGDTVIYAGGTALFSDKNAGPNKTVTGTGLSLSGVDAVNYSVNSTAVTAASITQRTLTVSATGINKPFDGNTVATVTLSDNRVSGDVFTDNYTSAVFSSPNVGAVNVNVSGISIAGADAANYTFNTSATTTGNIFAALTTTALTSSITGSTIPASILLTATVKNTLTSVAPAGTVQFTDTSTNTAVPGTISYSNAGSALQATLSASFPVGTHIVLATYTPNQNFGASASTTTNPSLAITAPASGFVQAANTNIPFAATFSDSSTASASAQWAFKSADTTVVNSGTVTPGNISNSFQLAVPGVYGITLTFNDGLGGIVSTQSVPAGMPAYAVVYDPTAGFVTGGGWINSAPGSYVPNPALTGKASFGFVSKYQKGANLPTGETQFTYEVANLDFHSTLYQWLVVSGPMAQYKGTGTINGTGNYIFLLTARDGSLTGGNTPDGFRLKIMDSTGSTIIYDNMIGATDDMTSTNTQALGGGSVVIHSK